MDKTNKMIFPIQIPNHWKVAISAWSFRIVSALVQIISIRVLFNYLGMDRYAIYVILYSLLHWCNLFDCGIGNSLQNYISEARVKSQDYSKYMTITLQIVTFLFLSLILILCFVSLPLQKVILAKYLFLPELQTSNLVLVICSIFITLTFVSIIIKVYYALQKGTIPNILQLIAIVISMLSIVLLNKFYHDNSSILKALLCFSLPQLILLGIPFFFTFKKHIKNIFCFDLSLIKAFIYRSLKFTGFTVMYVAILQVDYLIMARTVTSESVTAYNIFTRFFSFGLLIYIAFLNAFWPTCSEMFYRKELSEIKKLLQKYCIFGISIIWINIFFIFIFQNFLIKILVPNGNVSVDTLFFILFAIYAVFRVITDTYTIFLEAVSSLKIFWLILPIQLLLCICLQYFLSTKYGINGIILGSLLSFMLTTSWILPYTSYKILNKAEEQK